MEVRVPFLDHELLKFMASVPVAYKLKGLNTKTFLKKAFEGTLPNDVLYKKKQGFSIPLALWFRRELKDFVLEILSKERVERTGLLQYPAVQAMLNEHFSVKENHYRTIWSMIVFVLWHEANFNHSLV
ncbi:MAG: asparagine synthase-related protein [Calditrichia bacterium]